MTNQTEQGAALARLLDDDGENRAVRSFLLAYGAGCHKIGDMVSHMELSGWNDHPEFVAFKSLHNEHLTKAEAQDWLRHLFALEAPAVSTPEGYTSDDEAENFAMSKFASRADRDAAMLRELASLRAANSELAALASAPAAEPVGTLTVQRFRGHLENASFDYSGTLADGTYPLYTRPAAQDSNPQAQNAGWSGWACQYPGKLPRLYGAREIAELNFYPEEGDRLFQVREMAPGAVAPGLRFRVHKDPKTGSLYGSLPNVPPSEQEDAA